MVSRTPQEKYRRDMKRLLGDRADHADKFAHDPVTGEDISNQDQDLIEEFARAHDENDPTVPTETGKSYNTLARYTTNLMRVADRVELATATHDEINEVTHELVEEGRAKSTVRQIQMTLRTFYRYHDLEANPDNINTFARPDTSIDDRDMLTREEIERIEHAIDHPRDLCIFHLLIYTGQRVGAIRTLRVKDVKPEEGPSGRYWLNDEADGLKNADKNGGARPLLGAQSAVRDWLKYHPTGEPDHYLITGKPKYNKIDPTTPVTNETPRRMLKKVKEETGIDKPLYPHMLRHNFVTICKRDYDMADEDVKYLIGHSPNSKVMETTYSHLSAEDHNERVEAAAGKTERESKSPLSRRTCDTCGNHLEENAKACGRCGAVFTPDAQAAQNQIQQGMKDSYKETEPGSEAQAKVEALDELLDDPEVKAALLEKLSQD